MFLFIFPAFSPLGKKLLPYKKGPERLYAHPTIFPSLLSGKVNFGLAADCAINQPFSLRIVNAIGQQVLRERQVTLADELDISAFASGLYMLTLTFPDGRQVVRKVVKVR